MSTLIPKHTKKSVEFINTTVDKKGLKNLLAQIYLEFGGAKTAYLANTLKNLGFRYATKAGTTISIEDLDVPVVKKDLLKEAEIEIEKSSSDIPIKLINSSCNLSILPFPQLSFKCSTIITVP